MKRVVRVGPVVLVLSLLALSFAMSGPASASSGRWLWYSNGKVIPAGERVAVATWGHDFRAAEVEGYMEANSCYPVGLGWVENPSTGNGVLEESGWWCESSITRPGSVTVEAQYSEESALTGGNESKGEAFLPIFKWKKFNAAITNNCFLEKGIASVLHNGTSASKPSSFVIPETKMSTTLCGPNWWLGGTMFVQGADSQEVITVKDPRRHRLRHRHE